LFLLAPIAIQFPSEEIKVLLKRAFGFFSGMTTLHPISIIPDGRNDDSIAARIKIHGKVKTTAIFLQFNANRERGITSVCHWGCMTSGASHFCGTFAMETSISGSSGVSNEVIGCNLCIL
jgi:hypothetical protein